MRLTHKPGTLDIRLRWWDAVLEDMNRQHGKRTEAFVARRQQVYRNRRRVRRRMPQCSFLST